MALWLSLWGTAASVFLFFDLIWLLRVGRRFYETEIGHLLRRRPNLAAAGLFYLIYVSGLVTFVIEPSLGTASAGATFMLGGLFGLVAYGTFALTNLAIVEGFTAKIAAIDLAWGSLITGFTAALTVMAAQARFT
jgi:uncharacterized membrane protein